MKQYLDLLRDVRTNGVLKPTRAKLLSTGKNIDALSVFGRQMRFDLNEGFPLVTTKKVDFDAIAHELIWFLSGSTNVKYLIDNGVHIWDQWIKPDLNVGPPSDRRPLVWVPKRDRCGPSEAKGYATSCGAAAGSIDDKLRNAWGRMMHRCYDKTQHNYRFYGATGVTVAEEWHDASVFIRDVKELPNWGCKLYSWNDYDLDKDYYGSKCYSKETCVWLHYSENTLYTKSSVPMVVSEPGRPPRQFRGIKSAADEYDLRVASVHRFLHKSNKTKTLKGNNKRLKGWRFEPIKPRHGYLLRQAFSNGELGPVYGAQWRSWKSNDGRSIDQIRRIIDGIWHVKSNPESDEGRRLILSAWNVGDLHRMALPPCHIMAQFSVTNGRLSCMMTQRSADMALGVPYNIASYSLLTCILAHVTGLGVGEFIHSIGDAHLYCNHLDLADEQLKRKPLSPPNLFIREGLTDIDDLRFDDIILVGYKSHGRLKGEVAV